MIMDFIYARDLAIQKNHWVVVVTTSESFLEAQTAMAAIFNGYPFGGRTLILPGKARLSLVKAEDPVFLPKGTPFSVMFLGWGGAKVSKATPESDQWRKAAREIVSRNR